MIPLPSEPKVISTEGNVGVFEIEGLYPGYGVTVANSLRRVLLSSLEGAAPTQVKIKGIPHEFSTLEGVKEDAVMILLNLKQLKFAIHSEEPQTVTLKVKGEKKITASDLKVPSQLEIISKDAPIAELTSKSSELELELIVEKGTGYEPAGDRKKGKEEIGVIALDAIYTPVVKVKTDVKNMRVGERTDFDRLTIEIETDGTIAPEAALHQASEILVQQFGAVADSTKEVVEELKKKTTAKKEKEEEKE